MSYTASCPCLSDRRQYPTFFRTMPSDIYQARAIAQLAIRFNWTWIGAVVANNDYGHMAVKVCVGSESTTGVPVVVFLNAFPLWCRRDRCFRRRLGGGVCAWRSLRLSKGKGL